MDGLLQLASTIFLTFGLGTLLYALVSYALKQMVGEEPRAAARPQAPMYPVRPQHPVYYGQAHVPGPYAPAPPYSAVQPQGYPSQWTPQQPGGPR